MKGPIMPSPPPALEDALKSWPTKAGAWSYCSDVRARLCYARHLVKHGAHLFNHANALQRAFDERTKVHIVFESYRQRAAYRKQHENSEKSGDGSWLKPMTQENVERYKNAKKVNSFNYPEHLKYKRPKNPPRYKKPGEPSRRGGGRRRVQNLKFEDVC